MSVSALVMIGDVFHKILNTHKGFLTEKTHWKFLRLYLCSSMGSITSAFSLKILRQKEQGVIIKVVAVVHMFLNFLITDKSIIAERSSVPSQESKCLTTWAF